MHHMSAWGPFASHQSGVGGLVQVENSQGSAWSDCSEFSQLRYHRDLILNEAMQNKLTSITLPVGSVLTRLRHSKTKSAARPKVTELIL